MSNSKQAFWVLLGSIAAFIFSIVSSMILSRYLNKIDYGSYKQVLYIYNSLLIVFTLGLPRTYSFFLPRVSLEEAASAIKKINSLLIFSGILMSVSIFFGAESISKLLGNIGLVVPLKIFSAVPLFLIPTLGLEGILATYKKTKLLALFNIISKTFLLLGVVTPIVFFDKGLNSALIGFTIASFLVFILGMFLKFKVVKVSRPINTQLTYKDIFNYALPLLLAGLWGMVISSSDQFFISRYYGPAVFADFANGSLKLPFVTMIVSAASIVLAPVYSRLAGKGLSEDKEHALQLWNSVVSKTIRLIYPLIIFFILFSTEVMIVLYGQEYESSGGFFEIKLIVNFFTVISYAPLVMSVGGNNYYYRVHMYGAIFLVLSQTLAVSLDCSALTVVWVSVVCEILRIVAMVYFVARYFNMKIHKLFPWNIIFKVLPCILILSFIKDFIEKWSLTSNLISLLFLSFIVYITLFFIWARIARLDYRALIKPLLQRTK